MRSLPPTAGLLLFAALSPAWGQIVLAPVKLTEDGIAAGGIQLERLQAVRHAPMVGAFGQVVDPARLAALSSQAAEARADIAAAEARLKLAQDEAKRTASLYRAQGNVSMADYQSTQSAEQVAIASQVVAKSRLRALEANIRATWGAALAAAIETGDGKLAEIWTGSACLIQATAPFGSDLETAPPEATARPPSGPALGLTAGGSVAAVAEREWCGLLLPGQRGLLPADWPSAARGDGDRPRGIRGADSGRRRGLAVGHTDRLPQERQDGIHAGCPPDGGSHCRWLFRQRRARRGAEAQRVHRGGGFGTAAVRGAGRQWRDRWIGRRRLIRVDASSHHILPAVSRAYAARGLGDRGCGRVCHDHRPVRRLPGIRAPDRDDRYIGLRPRRRTDRGLGDIAGGGCGERHPWPGHAAIANLDRSVRRQCGVRWGHRYLPGPPAGGRAAGAVGRLVARRRDTYDRAVAVLNRRCPVRWPVLADPVVDGADGDRALDDAARAAIGAGGGRCHDLRRATGTAAGAVRPGQNDRGRDRSRSAYHRGAAGERHRRHRDGRDT